MMGLSWGMAEGHRSSGVMCGQVFGLGAHAMIMYFPFKA